MQTPPLQTQHLFKVLDEKLMELLPSLTQEEWNAQTVAKLWKVKDVAAHLRWQYKSAVYTKRKIFWRTCTCD